MEGYAAKQRRTTILIHVILIVMSFIMIVPFAWMILTALKTNQESISVSPFYILPHNGWHWENFGTVWKSYNFLILYKNTLLMIFWRVVCAVLTATMAGYAFGRLNFPGKNFLFSLVLVQMMIPAQIFIIPQYLMVSKMGMLNTQFGLVFPGLVTAFGTYLLKTGFEGLPKDLEEAAMIDGCNIGQRFLMIMMPLTKSSMVSRYLHRSFRIQGSYVADDRLHECKHDNTVSRSCQDAGSVRKRLSRNDGGCHTGSTSYDHHLCHLPEAVRGRYCDIGRKALIFVYRNFDKMSKRRGETSESCSFFLSGGDIEESRYKEHDE